MTVFSPLNRLFALAILGVSLPACLLLTDTDVAPPLAAGPDQTMDHDQNGDNDQDSGAGAAVDLPETECEPECLDSNTAHRCGDDGSMIEQRCEQNQYCRDGQCLDQVCEPDTRSCEGSAVVTCDAVGGARSVSYCNDLEECRGEDGFGCICANGECHQRACQPGGAICVDDILHRCNQEGTAGLEPVPCQEEEQCLVGSCVPITCTPDETRCIGNYLLTCTSASSWSILDCSHGRRPPTHICARVADAGDDPPIRHQCYNQVCAPNFERSCSSSRTTVLECNALGAGYDHLIECLETEVCHEGECVPVVCERSHCTDENTFIECTSYGIVARSVDCEADGRACSNDLPGCFSKRLVIALTWVTEGDPDPDDRGPGAGSDMDLHFLHTEGRWDEAPWDCMWRNRGPNWGDPESTDDDPVLSSNCDDGWGPEIIELGETDTPTEIFSIGAYYYSDHGYGPSDATLRILDDGVLSFQAVMTGIEPGQFWDVARIAWPGGQVERVHVLYPSGFP